MKTRFSKSILPGILAILLGACGIGLDGGIGGTGISSSGSIDGFGSVFVNGIEFTVNRATRISVEGEPNQPETELEIGYIVQVQGRLNRDGRSGTASSIDYLPEVEGPVRVIDASAASLIVLGQSVQSTNETRLINFTALGELRPGDLLEISGLRDADGIIQATYIEKRPPFMQGSSRLELSGTVRELTASSFTVGNLRIDYTSVRPQNLPATPLANGQLLRVESSSLPVNDTLMATQITLEPGLQSSEGDTLDIRAFITDIGPTGNFSLGRQSVMTGTASVFENGSAADLQINRRVLVRGTVRDGVLVATRIVFD